VNLGKNRWDVKYLTLNTGEENNLVNKNKSGAYSFGDRIYLMMLFSWVSNGLKQIL